MGNRKAREWMLQQDEEAQWQRIQTEPRLATQDVSVRGIGALRIQLIKTPAFQETLAWDVRNGPNGWTLFKSRGLPDSSELMVVGYDLVPFSPEKLAEYFNRIISIVLPLAPDLSGYGGADGTGYQIAFFGDLWSSWRFHWWSESPTGWRPLIAIAEEMFAEFGDANC